MPTIKKTDAYIIDTCKCVQEKIYKPGAITYYKRKKIEAIQWPDKTFDTQEEANDFVRSELATTGLREAPHEGALRR